MRAILVFWLSLVASGCVSDAVEDDEGDGGEPIAERESALGGVKSPVPGKGVSFP